jgi:hypothetical protein
MVTQRIFKPLLQEWIESDSDAYAEANTTQFHSLLRGHGEGTSTVE